MANQNNNVARKIVRAKEGFLIGSLLTESDLFNIYIGYTPFSLTGTNSVSFPAVTDNRGNIYKREGNTVHVFINMTFTNFTANATTTFDTLPLPTNATTICSAPANIVLTAAGTRERGRFEIAAGSSTLVIRDLTANFLDATAYRVTGYLVYQTTA